ncbi:MAG: LTA synthase family protein, partial [Clostridiales bacterium]|nr:LTA synthase family protein [Clostridiales bacterium]
WAQVFNIVLFELVAWLLFFLTGRLRAALLTEALLTMVYGLANAYVMRFRTNPIVPWDIFSWRTAVSVAGDYDFTPSVRMVLVTLLFLASMALLFFVKLEWKGFLKRLVPAVGVVILFFVFVNVLQNEDFQNRYRLYNKLFTPVFMTEVDGTAVTFAMNMAYMSIEKPTKYKRDEAAALLKAYENEDADGEQSTLPNVIVVMNEAFSDLSVLGDFSVNKDYMPYLHSLQQGAENTVTGMLCVSVLGGNTANTEFEFLTGNTMAFLPQGSVPYQQYIKGETSSLAKHLRGLGYQTVATHPYYASGWEREKVYPWLGFSESIFIDAYRRDLDVRGYVSDASCVEKIIELYEGKEKDRPLFLFQVTMQNHGGYQETYSNFTPEITAKGMDNVSLNQYLSLLRLSDQAFERLTDYFSKVEEKTVLVFFGDHQPNDAVAYSILAKNGMAGNGLSEEEWKLRYQVPYVIWANYDIEEAQNADTSANYLAAETLQRAGIPTNAYQNFLLELKRTYPILSAMEPAGTREEEKMELYQKLQYYILFDGGGMEK